MNMIPRQVRPLPPLRHGDNLTVAEFESRNAAMPELKKAELIDGVVYLPTPDFSNEAPRPKSPGKARIPPLVNGDHLSVAEFEQRYTAMPYVKKAELIEGVVYMPSPVTMSEHGEPHFQLVGWLGPYVANTPGVQAGDNATVRLRTGLNQPQPDICVRLREEFGGSSKLVKGFVEGPPELVVEVSYSSVSYDLHQKLHAYEKNGVQEYLVWRIEDMAIDWFALRDGEYKPLRGTSKGLLKSRVFPGLWLDGPALLVGHLARVLEVAQQGIASPEHARFVKKLEKRAQ